MQKRLQPLTQKQTVNLIVKSMAAFGASQNDVLRIAEALRAAVRNPWHDDPATDSAGIVATNFENAVKKLPPGFEFVRQ